MMPVGAGNLRYSVGFYQRQAGPAPSSPPLPDYGDTEGSFPSSANFVVPANIMPKLGGEDVLASRLTGKNLVNITVRQSTTTATVTTDWIAKNERSGEVYNIRSIIDPYGSIAKHGFYFEMLCEEGVAT
jgi:hypothetical protein